MLFYFKRKFEAFGHALSQLQPPPIQNAHLHPHHPYHLPLNFRCLTSFQGQHLLLCYQSHLFFLFFRIYSINFILFYVFNLSLFASVFLSTFFSLDFLNFFLAPQLFSSHPNFTNNILSVLCPFICLISSTLYNIVIA